MLSSQARGDTKQVEVIISAKLTTLGLGERLGEFFRGLQLVTKIAINGRPLSPADNPFRGASSIVVIIGPGEPSESERSAWRLSIESAWSSERTPLVPVLASGARKPEAFNSWKAMRVSRERRLQAYDFFRVAVRLWPQLRGRVLTVESPEVSSVKSEVLRALEERREGKHAQRIESEAASERMRGAKEPAKVARSLTKLEQRLDDLRSEVQTSELPRETSEETQLLYKNTVQRESDPLPKASAAYELGILALQESDWEVAKQWFRMAAEEAEKAGSAGAHLQTASIYNSGIAALNDGLREEAANLFRRAADLATDSPETAPTKAASLYNLSLVTSDVDPDEARELLHRAVETAARALGSDHPTVRSYESTLMDHRIGHIGDA